MPSEDTRDQDSALEILQEGIKKGRIFSAYLFIGPDGSGRNFAAKNFAKTVNCLSEKNAPCDKCIACKKIESEIHPDVFFIERNGISSSIGIDQIRDAITQVNFKPYEGKRKVFIIKDAHSMNTEASNAFLKTLEEPPLDTTFILITRSGDLLLPTIVSRCNIVRFSLQKVFKTEDKDLVHRRDRLINSLLNNRDDFKEVMSAYSNREGLKENLDFIISFLRDLFLCKVATDETMFLNAGRIDDIKTKSEIFSMEELDYLIKRVITLRSYVDYNVNPKIITDVLVNELGRFYAQPSASKTA